MAVHIQMARKNWIHDVADYYETEFVSRTHPDIMQWPLIGNAWHCLSIMATYAIFINYIGPAIMRNRKAFDLRWLMVPYNIFLVVVNFYVFFEFAKIRWSGGAEVTCDTMYTTLDRKTDPHKYRLAEITWYFYITKFIELIDTVFFVLRKKERQLSRLHLVHHTTVPIIVFLMLRSEPGVTLLFMLYSLQASNASITHSGGYNSFFPLANSFVHCIMYTYYGISAVGDDVTIHLKFKKYVTMTQMVQFILVLYYFISRPFYGCQWHWLIGSCNLILAGFFFVLFSNFYWHEYLKIQEDKQKAHQNGYDKHKTM